MAARRSQSAPGDVLKQYQALRNQLIEERNSILERLAQIEEALGGSSNEPASIPKPRGRKPASEKKAPAKKKAKRKLSAAARKAISDAQKKRWAKTKGAKASPAKGKLTVKALPKGMKAKGKRVIGTATLKK